MEYRFLVNYTLDEQQESLEVIKDSPELSPDEAKNRVDEAIKPYGKTSQAQDIKIHKVDKAEDIDTDPENSASE